MGKKLKGKDLIRLGFPQNNSINIALGQINQIPKSEKEARFGKLENVAKSKNYEGHTI